MTLDQIRVKNEQERRRLEIDFAAVHTQKQNLEREILKLDKQRVDLARIEISDVLLFNINTLIDEQLLELEGKQLRTTAQGRPLLNAILRQLLRS